MNKITSLSQARKLGLRLVKSLALTPQFSSPCPTRRLFAGAAENRKFCKEVSFPWSLICRLKTKIWQGRGLQGFVKTEATFFSHIKEESSEWQQGVAENKISQPKARPDPAIWSLSQVRQLHWLPVTGLSLLGPALSHTSSLMDECFLCYNFCFWKAFSF